MSNIFTRPFCETPWGRAQGCPFFTRPACLTRVGCVR